jgi:hypothetical protein
MTRRLVVYRTVFDTYLSLALGNTQTLAILISSKEHPQAVSTGDDNDQTSLTKLISVHYGTL